MVGTVISGVAALGSAVMSGIASARQAKANNRAYNDYKKEIEEQKNRIDALRNADSTQLADVSAILNNGQNTLRRQTKAISGTNAVIGGTNASAAAQKEIANNTYAGMVRDANVTGQAYKERLDTQRNSLLTNDKGLIDSRLAGNTAANKLTMDATGKAMTAAQEFGTALDDYTAKNTEK